MTRRTNDAGVQLIGQWEGCKLTAYPDVKGVWTIGFGHTRGVTEGMEITQEQADALLRADLQAAEAVVDHATGGSQTTDNQFAAMVALCFNIGGAAYLGSTVLREHLAGHPMKAADAFMLWNKARIDGVLTVVPGLTNRRNAERTLYLAP